MTSLYSWQSDALEFSREHPKSWIALDPGMGKSRVAVERAREEGGLTVIVVPPHLRKNWVNEFKLWWPEALPKIQVVKKASENPTKRIIIISYNMMTSWVGAKKLAVPNVFIADEAHYAKSWKAKRTKAVCKVVKVAPNVMLLTGTPIVNRPAELGPLLQSLGVFKNKMAFEADYCAGWAAPWGWDATGNSDPEGLRNLLADLMIRRDKSLLGDVTAGRLPPRVIELEVTGAAKREKAFDKAAVMKNPNPVAFEGLSELLAWSGEQKAPPAADHIMDILESEDKVVVFFWHSEVGDILEKKLGKYGVSRIDGKTKDKDAALDAFKADHRVLIANHRAAGTGLNIVEASYVVFVEAPWSPGDLDQCISRCDRIGQDTVVRTDIFTVAGSIDGHIIHALLDKQGVINEVVEEMAKNIKVNDLDRAVYMVFQDHCEKRRLEPEELIHAVEMDIEKHGTSAVVEEEKPKPKAKPKAKKKPEPEEIVISISDIRAAARAYMNEKGGPAMKKILSDFGAANLSALSEDDYAGFMDKVAL